jgi:hypothetical protein
MKSIEELVQSIDARLEELRAEIEALTGARQGLGANDATVGRATPARTRRAVSRRARGAIRSVARSRGGDTRLTQGGRLQWPASAGAGLG